MPKIRPLNEDLQKAAVEQLNEVPERVADDIEALKIWIKQQPHLRARTNDQFLVAFLRGCKYSLEKAKSKIDKFYTYRTKYPDLFTCCDVDGQKFREIISIGVLSYLPVPLNGNGPRIAIMRNGPFSPERYSVEDIAQVMQGMAEITMLEDDYANINGIVFIMDMENATMGHLLQWTPGTAKKMTVFSEEAMPLRPKASHFINTPSMAEPLFNMIKPMMSKKQQDRLFVHGNKMDLLLEQIPKKFLPTDYGGENGSFEEISKCWDKKFDEYRDHFRDNKNYGTDERLRQGNPIDFDNIFGMEGSFRKLNVD